MKRNYRCVSANPTVRCRTVSTLEKAEKVILEMIKNEDEELDHVRDDLDNGYIWFTTYNDWSFVIVDLAKRKEINTLRQLEGF